MKRIRRKISKTSEEEVAIIIEGVSINQFISSAVAEKISAIMTEDYLKDRAKRAKKSDFKKILDKVPKRKPISGDEL